MNRCLSEISVLKLDKDCIVSRSLMQEWIRVVVIPTCKAHGVTVLSVAVCPSPRKGFHVYVEITPPVHAELAWRLQFLLGDDCRRVSLNRARLRAGFSDWNKLFEAVGTKPTTIYKRALSTATVKVNVKPGWNRLHEGINTHHRTIYQTTDKTRQHASKIRQPTSNIRQSTRQQHSKCGLYANKTQALNNKSRVSNSKSQTLSTCKHWDYTRRRF
jgi:hypothetical protein